jgi:hypothetical protein
MEHGSAGKDGKFNGSEIDARKAWKEIFFTCTFGFNFLQTNNFQPLWLQM